MARPLSCFVPLLDVDPACLPDLFLVGFNVTATCAGGGVAASANTDAAAASSADTDAAATSSAAWGVARTVEASAD